MLSRENVEVTTSEARKSAREKDAYDQLKPSGTFELGSETHEA
jgi:hypothetical protein